MIKRKHIITDGVKSYSLENPNVWSLMQQDSDDLPKSAPAAYKLVPYLYRAVDIRARTLSNVPYAVYRGNGSVDVSDSDVYAGLLGHLREALYLIESALCLYGYAYLLIERNRFGRNPTLRWMAPQTVTPQYNQATGELKHFRRTTQSGTTDLVLEQVAYVWQPDPSSEVTPGPAPATVALRAAGVLAGVDVFSDSFFKRGATKAMLLAVDGNPAPEQVQKLEGWWQRMVSGVRNAWTSVVVSASLNPVVIGDGLGDLDTAQIVEPRRQDIAAALGTPYSLLSPASANYATARQERLTFLTSTIVPEAEMIAAALNEQVLQPAGLRLEFDPSLMEEYQAAEFEKTMSLVPLFDAGIITKDEIRALLGYEPLEEEEPEPDDDTDDDDADWEAMDAEATADLDDASAADGFTDDTDPATKSAIWQRVYADALKRAPAGGGVHWRGQARDKNGRFAKMPGSGQRQQERTTLRTGQQAERKQAQQRHQQERTSLRERHQAERAATRGREARSEMASRHRQERAALQQRQATERSEIREQHSAARTTQRFEHQSKRAEEVRAFAEEQKRNNPKAYSLAFGNDPNTTYQMRTKVVDMGDVRASNTPGGGINPDYDAALQPRDRSRAASQQQIDKVARDLVPEAVLMDFHAIDKGSPIVDADGNVLSGNGRTLAMQRMQAQYPEKWQAYQEKLRQQAKEHGISESEIAQMKAPVLVRELVADGKGGDVDRVRFAQEANNPPVLQMSPLERAKNDSRNLSEHHLGLLSVGDEGIDVALRRKSNVPFVQSFMSTLSDNERGQLLRGDGTINKAGIERVKAALFTRTFPGESGGRLAETFLEAVDSDTKSIETAITGALPRLAKAEGLMQSGARDRELSLTNDFAKAVEVHSRLKESGWTLDDYMGQSSMFGTGESGRETTADQERILGWLDSNARKPKVMREMLQRYASEVENAADPAQGSLLGGEERLTRGELLDRLFGPAQDRAAQGAMF